MPKHCKVFYDGMSKDFSTLQSKLFLLSDHKLKSRIKVLMLQTNPAERCLQEAFFFLNAVIALQRFSLQ